MGMLEQLLIVIAALALLPLVVKLLWRVYLIPVAAYFVCTRLIWPAWAAENHLLCIGLFAASVLIFVGAWTLKIIQRRRENESEIQRLLASAIPLNDLYKN